MLQFLACFATLESVAISVLLNNIGKWCYLCLESVAISVWKVLLSLFCLTTLESGAISVLLNIAWNVPHTIEFSVEGWAPLNKVLGFESDLL